MRGDEFFTQVAPRPPFTQLHPRLGAFFQQYFSREKAVSFNGKIVVNTSFPPYPSPAFDQLAVQFAQLGNADARRLYSVTLAVTNRCSFNCWHCYNAGRSQTDLPLAILQSLAADLQQLGAVMITLTGGEPLLRDDLVPIVQAFDPRSCLILGTTGAGLAPERARALRDAGLFAVGISLDSDRETEHDQCRGQTGAFKIALRAIDTARAAGLYPYVVSVATREFLSRERFLPFLRFAGSTGALEVHLLEPSATGRLAGRTDILLTARERQQLFDYQAEIAQRDDLPILSAFAYLESSEAFGCGAGLTHLYIDGSGEVCPCNLVPLSFGNISREPLRQILQRMGGHFRKPRTGCVGRQLLRHFPQDRVPASPAESDLICAKHLPRTHDLPRFFRLHEEVQGEKIRPTELRAAYDRVYASYDDFWLVSAGQPVEQLVNAMTWTGAETVFEAGCGTGYGTALLARRAARVVAVDLSEGMLSVARVRLQSQKLGNVEFKTGDALHLLGAIERVDCVFSSWVLGYIPLAEFFNVAACALVEGGRLVFVVHKENSPREPLEIFGELIAQNPSALLKRVAFDFPRDADHVRTLLATAGFQIDKLWEGTVQFRYPTPALVLEHLLESGAGTAFYDAVDPNRRETLTRQFLQRLADRHPNEKEIVVAHEYIAVVASKKLSFFTL